jgi:DedD protein
VERHVKERLVGAAVLMAAAIILIPEMLSGPDRKDTEGPANRESSIKTYTIDLNDPPGSQSAQGVVREAAPPQETAAPPASAERVRPETNPSRSDEANPQTESPPAATPLTASPVSPEENPSGSETRQPRDEVQLPDPPPSVSESRPPALASEPGVPTSRGWAIQLGSFSNRASADRLAADFRADRYDAFVMPVKSGSATLYRVRIGPMKERSAAEQMLRTVKVKVTGAAVVAHP